MNTNQNSYIKNAATSKAIKRYIQSVRLSNISILTSINLFLESIFIAIEIKPTKVQVVSEAKK